MTPLRGKKSLTQKRCQNKSRSVGLLGAEDTNTDTHTHTHTQIYIDVNVEANILNERYLKNGLCLSSSILVQMPSQETMLYLTLRKVFKSWALVYWAPNSLFQSPGVSR